MREFILLMLLFPCFYGYSQADKNQLPPKSLEEQNYDKKDSLTGTFLLKRKSDSLLLPADEGTNDPLMNGYVKVTIEGREVYQKKMNSITIIYDPKK